MQELLGYNLPGSGKEVRRLGGGLLVQLCELLEDGGHVGEPLLDLGGGAAPGELGQAPGAGRPVRVDVGDEALARPRPRPRHDQLGVVLEVVNLQHGTVSRGRDDTVIVRQQFHLSRVSPVYSLQCGGGQCPGRRGGQAVWLQQETAAWPNTAQATLYTSTTNTASVVRSSEEARQGKGGPGPRSVSFQFLVFENIYGLFQKLLKP